MPFSQRLSTSTSIDEAALASKEAIRSFTPEHLRQKLVQSSQLHRA